MPSCLTLGMASLCHSVPLFTTDCSQTRCSHFAVFETCSSYNAAWYSDTNSYNTNADEGCRDPGVPHIREACYDWKNGRAHFLANGQPKRCLKLNYRRSMS